MNSGMTRALKGITIATVIAICALWGVRAETAAFSRLDDYADPQREQHVPYSEKTPSDPILDAGSFLCMEPADAVRYLEKQGFQWNDNAFEQSADYGSLARIMFSAMPFNVQEPYHQSYESLVARTGNQVYGTSIMYRTSRADAPEYLLSAEAFAAAITGTAQTSSFSDEKLSVSCGLLHKEIYSFAYICTVAAIDEMSVEARLCVLSAPHFRAAFGCSPENEDAALRIAKTPPR